MRGDGNLQAGGDLDRGAVGGAVFRRERAARARASKRRPSVTFELFVDEMATIQAVCGGQYPLGHMKMQTLCHMPVDSQDPGITVFGQIENLNQTSGPGNFIFAW